MFLETSADTLIACSIDLPAAARPRWGVRTEHDPLTDVMLCEPRAIAPVPCCSVTRESLAQGFAYAADAAARQHARLVATLEAAGARCHIVPAADDLPDLAFARDATFMTPWGLLLLNPAAPHRRRERAHIAAAARGWGVPVAGSIDDGFAEGGDICLLRDGLVVIGYSGERTDRAGAEAVARFFAARGWRSLLYRFDPYFLHLDTQFTMIDAGTALASVEVLAPEFRASIAALGIETLAVSRSEVQSLAANVLSLGRRRIVAAAENARVNALLRARGFEVLDVELAQFTHCGGGVHCLTMPLARQAA
jgi:N-dimethylarginine dimethylaminohydrolase